MPLLEGDNYIRFILALVLVLGLLGLAAWLLRRAGYGSKLGRTRRLAALETLPLGPRHRLMLIRRDDVEHLLLLGPQGDIVVERNIVTGDDGLARSAPSGRSVEADDLIEEEYGREPTFGHPLSGGPADNRPPDNRFADMLRAHSRDAQHRDSQHRDSQNWDNQDRDTQNHTAQGRRAREQDDQS